MENQKKQRTHLQYICESEPNLQAFFIITSNLSLFCLLVNSKVELESCAGILEQSMGARNRVGIGPSYWPARLYRLADRFLGIDSWATNKFKYSVSVLEFLNNFWGLGTE